MIDEEIRKALQVDASPEFLARVRTRIASEPAPAAWRWSWGFAAACAVAASVVAVVVLTPRKPPLCEETEEFRAVVKAAFAQRRKTLRNAWRALAGVNDEQISLAAGRAEIDLDARGETLDAAAFARMASELARTRG